MSLRSRYCGTSSLNDNRFDLMKTTTQLATQLMIKELSKPGTKESKSYMQKMLNLSLVERYKEKVRQASCFVVEGRSNPAKLPLSFRMLSVWLTLRMVSPPFTLLLGNRLSAND